MKYLSAITFFLLMLFGRTQPGYSQSTELHFEHLTEKDGLSNSNVIRILQDREGFMWFGTLHGLNKYDGYSFNVFKHDPNNRAHSMQSVGDRAIREDKEGNLWVVTWGGAGLNKIDKRTGSITPFVDSFSTVFLSLHEDPQGFFWIGTGRGLVRFNPKKEEFIRYTNTAPATAIAEDASGKLWTFSRSIFQFDRRTGRYTLFPQNFFTDSSHAFNAVHLDEKGVLWIGTNGKGLVTLDTKKSSPQLTPYNPGGLVNQTINTHGIYADADGFLWLATSEGLQRINPKTNEVLTYRSDPAQPGTLSSNYIGCVYKDREGTLWVGTDNGINKAVAHRKPFHVYQVFITSLPVRLPENKIRTIVEDRAGAVWLGNQKGLYQFNPRNGQIKHIDANPADPGSLSSEGVGFIYEDRSGRLWVSTKEALHRLNPETGKFIRYPTQFPVIAMDEALDGKIWIAAKIDPGRGAIAYLDSSTRQFRYYYRSNDNAGLNFANLYAILASRTGDIWVGTSGGGLNRLNPKTGKFTYYKSDYRFTPGHLNDVGAVSLFEDAQGIIWAGTDKGGLNRFDPQTNAFTAFTTREGLPSNEVRSIISDAKGHLWLGTLSGISRFDPTTKTFRNFDVSDGLPDNAFYIGSVYNRNGKLLFGSADGFVIFHPDSIKDNTRPPPVYITGLKVLEKSRPLSTDSLEFPYDENFLSFDFVALNYDSPEKNQYAYMLEGLDKNWIYSNSRRYASYTSLPHGNYTFRVKASNNDGVWNEKGASLTILIHPPWWRTWWAFAFYSLCFLAGLVLIDRYQRRRLVQKERERSRERELAQAKEIEKAYHELKTTQAQLIQSEKMASLGELTAGIAHEIQNPLNFVNNFSEVTTELLDELSQGPIQKLPKEEIDTAKEILNDAIQNLHKITHHGKRADAIVKGMLQHSRTSTGKKEPTDLNALADEYLRLSYHGLRAKDKLFNADFKTDFDESIGKIEVIPQDIGRVLLNIYNNAFYSVNEKKIQLDGAFEPVVSVSTKRSVDKVEICVTDNGIGIPKQVLDKIYQPFFTTKPTGQGTGLGLSLSYDIIKAHGGELKVETKEGEGAEFVVELPLK
ncbi:MAG: two-component regulator propeller domain-containing protein [Chitinophagaceae bacterium]